MKKIVNTIVSITMLSSVGAFASERNLQASVTPFSEVMASKPVTSGPVVSNVAPRGQGQQQVTAFQKVSAQSDGILRGRLVAPIVATGNEPPLVTAFTNVTARAGAVKGPSVVAIAPPTATSNRVAPMVVISADSAIHKQGEAENRVTASYLGEASHKETKRQPVIEFDNQGRMKRPARVEEWVFLGSSVGMTYINTDIDPEDPGLFSTVLMEPDAYRHFKATGNFKDGTTFVKIIHASEVGHGGASMAEPVYMEAHIKDKTRFPETGSGFFAWTPDAPAYAEVFPVEMGCVACHKERASYDDVFTQFYPTIRQQAEAAKANRKTN